MGALIQAGVVFVITLSTCALVIVGGMTSDSRGTSISGAPIFLGGSAVAGLVLASDWTPAIGW